MPAQLCALGETLSALQAFMQAVSCVGCFVRGKIRLRHEGLSTLRALVRLSFEAQSLVCTWFAFSHDSPLVTLRDKDQKLVIESKFVNCPPITILPQKLQ